MPLTHYALLHAQPREKIYKLFDGHGLYLQIAPTGGKWWRVKYRLRGREQCLSLGTFPAVALKAARQRCEEQGVAMLSSVLRSHRAIAVNVQIMRAFVRMRELLASNTALARKLDELERKYQHHDEAIKAILSAIRELMTPVAPKHRPIGFTANLGADK
jgi:Arm DNA-binding domain